MDYSSKQVEPVLSKEEVLSRAGMHNAEWRLVRKRYSIRVEFDQAGSLGIPCVLASMHAYLYLCHSHTDYIP